VTLSTCSGGNTTNFDTQISVFTGSCDNLQCLVGNDDDADCAGICSLTWCTTFTSTVRFIGELNVTYYVRVHGHDVRGDFGLTVEESDRLVDSGINDFCSDSNATFLVAGAMVTGSLDGAQNYIAESCASIYSGNVGLWCK
jgi:hypothetical protein